MNINTKIALKYGAKRICLYTLVGVLLSSLLTPLVGLIALPSVLLAAIPMAYVDVKSVSDFNKPLQVFNKTRMGLLIGIAIIVVLENTLTWEFFPNADFTDLYFFLLLVSISVCVLFFIFFSSEYGENHIKHRRHRFLGYLLMGLTAAIFPLVFGILLGFPIILTGAVLMASTDSFDSDAPHVFTHAFWKAFLALLGFIIIYGLLYFILF